MKPRVLIAAGMLLLVCAGFANAQDDVLASYKTGTIPGLIAEFSAATKSTADYVSATESYLIKTRVTYSGSSRKLPEKKRAFLAKWLKDNKYPEAMLPTNELLVTEGDRNYWLVMQDIVAPHFEQEIKPGGQVDLYLVLLGSVKEGSERSFVILINEFKRPEDAGPSGPRTGKLKAWESGAALNGYEDYAPRTLREIITNHSELLDKSNVLLTGDTFSSRVKLIYTGSSRKISAAKKQHLDIVLKSFKVDPEQLARYQTEMLFLEGNDEHWLAVQRELIPFLQKELTKDEEVIVYTEWLGAIKADGKWEWVFIVNEFQKMEKPTITAPQTRVVTLSP